MEGDLSNSIIESHAPRLIQLSAARSALELGPVPGAARFAVSAIFFINGLTVSNWLARIPAAQAQLGLSEGRLGFALLGMAVGALVAMTAVGWVVARSGSRPVTTVSVLVLCVALPLPALASNALWLGLALVVLGASNGALDVAMNAQGVAVERRYRRPILSSFHAAFSAGGLLGASTGGFAAYLKIDPLPHLAGVGLLLIVPALFVSRRLLPASADMALGERGAGVVRPSRRLVLLGAIGFCGLLGEGAVADWSAVYLDSALTTGPALAAAGFAAFSLTMTVGRLLGDRLVQAWGPVEVTRRGGALAGGGLGAALLVDHPIAAVIGFACVGAGLAAIVPVIFSAAGGLPSVAPGPAIAAVSVAGYTGFLVGPPLIGLTAEVVGLPVALGVVALIVGVIVPLAANVAPGVPARKVATGLPAAR